MARTTERLTATLLTRLRTKPGLYHDGGGLYLQVRKGAASWVLRYMLDGRPRTMGLGPLRLYGLADARTRARDAHRLRHDGADPIEAKRAGRRQRQIAVAKAITFASAASSYIAAHRAGWRGSKVEGLWRSTLKTYAEPVIGELPVAAVDTGLVVKILAPLWSEKPETAGRVRQRIEAVLDWARVQGYREGENPARWRGHLDKLLPARGKVRRVEHHAALPFAGIAAFIGDLRAREAVAARALEFLILTAARTGEVLEAPWSEINLADKVWIVPAERMKAAREHRVPLSPRAVEILDTMAKLRPASDKDGASYIFPGAKRGKPLSNMALLVLLRRMGRGGLTAHGFRSTFRDWASERTNYPGEMAEMALAHAIPDKVEAAYRRGDLFERRRRMMTAWATFCAKDVVADRDEVVSIG